MAVTSWISMQAAFRQHTACSRMCRADPFDFPAEILFGFTSLWRFNNEVNTAETKALLKQYVCTGSEPAFRELVDRYVGLVYSSAVRLLGSESHLADDVTQRVFIQLVRKASELPESVSLGGWLHRSTCHIAATTLRSELRRHARERQAMELHALTNQPDQALAAIAPMLDDAIESLDAEDRAAILLRFFEKHSYRAVGQALQVTEDAARMRVNRALAKLHALLKTRGTAISVTALGAALTAGNLTAAPRTRRDRHQFSAGECRDDLNTLGSYDSIKPQNPSGGGLIPVSGGRGRSDDD